MLHITYSSWCMHAVCMLNLPDQLGTLLMLCITLNQSPLTIYITIRNMYMYMYDVYIFEHVHVLVHCMQKFQRGGGRERERERRVLAIECYVKCHSSYFSIRCCLCSSFLPSFPPFTSNKSSINNIHVFLKPRSSKRCS